MLLPWVLRTNGSFCFVCSYSTLSFMWLVFFNFLKILGCVVTLMNDGLYWINSKGSWHAFCLLLLRTVSPWGLPPEWAGWLNVLYKKGSQWNVVTASIFEVPLEKKWVTEQEPPSGLVRHTTEKKCSSVCHLQPVFSVSVCDLELQWGLFDFSLRSQHLHKIISLETSSMHSPDFDNSSWTLTAEQSHRCQTNSSLYICVVGRTQLS